MKGGVLIYKCRRCGALDESLHAPDVITALVCLTGDYDLPKQWGGMPVSKLDIHHCDDKHLGVMDLIGGREDQS